MRLTQALTWFGIELSANIPAPWEHAINTFDEPSEGDEDV